MNLAIIVGKLGADPEVRTTPGGTTLCKLSVATNERQKDRDGNWTDRTEWHRCTLFGKSAENAGRYLSKGREVAIRGRIRTSSYEKNGEKRYSTEILVDDIKYLGGGQRR